MGDREIHRSAGEVVSFATSVRCTQTESGGNSASLPVRPVTSTRAIVCGMRILYVSTLTTA